MKKFVLIALATFALASCNQEKTAYVDNTVLMKDYKAMKTTQESFQKRSQALKSQMDSVAQGFQKEVQEYQKNMKSLSSAEREKKEGELMQKQQQLQRQQQMQSSMLQNQSDKVMDSIIDQVKDFVADYGKDHGYTYIFGSNESANIMYAKEGKDITEDVLEKLNANIEGEDDTLSKKSDTTATKK